MLLFIIALRIFVSYNLLCTKYYTSYRPNQLISIAWHREAAEVEEEVVAAEGELPPRKPRQQKRKRLKRLVSFLSKSDAAILLCLFSIHLLIYQMTFLSVFSHQIAPATDMFGGGDGGDY